MSDIREALEQERRRFRMSEGSMEDLKRRRDSRRRNRRIASASVAVVVAATGALAAFVAFRDTSPAPKPAATPPVVTTSPPGVKQPAPPSSTLQFLDQLHGWAVFGGKLVETTDGGTTWSARSGNPDAELLQFVDANHGWAASADELWQTTDGGVHWQSLGNEVLTTFQFLAPEVGWGVEGGHEESVGLLVKTTDGGRTWTSQDLQANSVCFGELGYGWATGPSASGISLWQKLDDGKKWTENNVPFPNANQGAYEATLSCSGIDAWVLVTGDAGAGHVAYALFRTVGEGSAELEPVVQDGFTHPLGQQKNVFESPDPQPGPLVTFGEVGADFITWCPPCGPTSAVNVKRETTSWERIEFPQSAQGEPVGLSFVDEDHGWVAFNATLPNAGGDTSNALFFGTSDGGGTWSMLSVYRTAG